MVVSVLKLADGWLSSSLVRPTSEVDLTADTAEAAELLSHLFHGHPHETGSTVIFFHFALSLLFLFSSDIQTFVLMEPQTLFYKRNRYSSNMCSTMKFSFQYVLYQKHLYSNMCSTKIFYIIVILLTGYPSYTMLNHADFVRTAIYRRNCNSLSKGK